MSSRDRQQQRAVPEDTGRDLFRATLDAVPDAVIVVDAAGVIITANIQVTSVFGYRPAELEGRKVEVLVPARVRRSHPQTRSGYNHRAMGLLALSATRKDGTEFPAEISLAPISFAGVHLTAATVRDITERLELEAEADRMRDELLATVSHELRTPLTSILGYAELMGDLDEGEVGPQARRMLATITRSAERELRLVTDLLTTAVTSLAPIHLVSAPFDFASLAAETVQEHQASARRNGILLTCTVQPLAESTPGELKGPTSRELPAAETTAFIDGDRHRLRQVLDNLISNSVKFTPVGGNIVVTTRSLSNSIIATVDDTGSGIDADEQEHVFERLYRAKNATASVTQGAGLGLNIVKSIIEAHRGSITLTSQTGLGTTVTLQLPRRAHEV